MTMKKRTMLAMSVLMVITFISSASAFESKFGGYWRTRVYTQNNFSGEDKSESKDITQADTRTRLYYTAIFNEEFKFVNKFEMDAIWGDNPKSNTYGDIGADGQSLEIKNSYVDYSPQGPWNVKVGVQNFRLLRKFLFSDDAAGVIVTHKGDSVTLPLIWLKAYEGSSNGGEDANDNDVDYYGAAPSINLNNIKLTPTILWVTSEDGSAWGSTSDYKDFDSYYIGLDLDAKLSSAVVWFTGIYQTGEVETAAGESQDISAWLAAIGGKANVGPAKLHGQVFYATGDDDATDDELNAYFIPKGNSYYWSEIMGKGVFDGQASANSCHSHPSDILAANIGATFKLADKLKMTADLWYAKLAEEDANGEDELGTEVDLVVSYNMMKNVNLDIVGAYLIAGEATYSGDNEANPYEIGTRWSFKF
jgi:hypothetical protein